MPQPAVVDDVVERDGAFVGGGEAPLDSFGRQPVDRRDDVVVDVGRSNGAGER